MTVEVVPARGETAALDSFDLPEAASIGTASAMRSSEATANAPIHERAARDTVRRSDDDQQSASRPES